MQEREGYIEGLVKSTGNKPYSTILIYVLND